MGDTLVSTVRTYLKAVYYVDGDAEALVCSTGFAVLTPGPGTQPKYVSYLVQSNTFTDRVTAESVGTAYPAIAEGRLGSFYVPFPPSPNKTPSSNTSTPRRQRSMLLSPPPAAKSSFCANTEPA